MDERSTKVSDLLHEAAETHHQVFRITDGTDDDRASWYAQWLVTLSELPQVLGGTVVRSELTYLLVRLDKEYIERRPDERWEDFYARELVRHFSQGDA
jgi:asparagine synthetase A